MLSIDSVKESPSARPTNNVPPANGRHPPQPPTRQTTSSSPTDHSKLVAHNATDGKAAAKLQAEANKMAALARLEQNRKAKEAAAQHDQRHVNGNDSNVGSDQGGGGGGAGTTSAAQMLKGQNVRIWVLLSLPLSKSPFTYTSLIATLRNRQPRLMATLLRRFHRSLLDRNSARTFLPRVRTPLERNKSLLHLYRNIINKVSQEQEVEDRLVKRELCQLSTLETGSFKHKVKLEIADSSVREGSNEALARGESSYLARSDVVPVGLERS